MHTESQATRAHAASFLVQTFKFELEVWMRVSDVIYFDLQRARCGRIYITALVHSTGIEKVLRIGQLVVVGGMKASV